MAWLVCWHCGHALSGIGLPIKHFDLCPTCREELHCCSMCRSYAPQLGGTRCRKDEADYVNNKQAANYCHYFQASAHAFDNKTNVSNSKLNALGALFGGETIETDGPSYEKNNKQAEQGLAELFGDQASTTDGLSVEEKSLHELDKLFGKEE